MSMPHGPRLEQHDWDGMKLRNWRKEQDIHFREVCAKLDISPATLYRFETGYVPPLQLANKIVSMTRGAIRYRDIYHSFRPEYA